MILCLRFEILCEYLAHTNLDRSLQSPMTISGLSGGLFAILYQISYFLGMKDFLLNRIDEWVNELHSGSTHDKERADLLMELKTELQKESESLDRLSKRVITLEEELLRRLHVKVGDYAVATIDGEERIGQISEIHTVALSPGIVLIALSPHFYPEYLVDIDKLRKPLPEEIRNFETNRLSIEEDIKRKEEIDND